MDVTADLGQFDYIIAHGVYSWVPPMVRDKLLTICQQNLAPNGIAYVSYNAYPGWHYITAVREMMLYHTRRETDPVRRVAEARWLLEFLTSAMEPNDGLHAASVHFHHGMLNEQKDGEYVHSDSYLAHDHLEATNDPVYFHQFAAHVAAHGLQYLCDANFQTDVAGNFRPGIADKLSELAHDVIEMEQYIDFVRNRMFRRSLLCHAGQSINRSMKPQRLRSLYIGSRAMPESPDPDLHAVSVEKFIGTDGAKLTIDHPLSKAAMLCLSRRWPGYVSLEALAAEAQALLQDGNPASLGPDEVGPEDLEVLAVNLLKAFVYSDSLVEFHSSPPCFTVEVAERPVASPWVRLQANTTLSVTNLRHERTILQPFDAFLLQRLDGTRDRAALLDELAGPIAAGAIAVRDGDEAVTDAARAVELTVARLPAKLENLARLAMFVR